MSNDAALDKKTNLVRTLLLQRLEEGQSMHDKLLNAEEPEEDEEEDKSPIASPIKMEGCVDITGTDSSSDSSSESESEHDWNALNDGSQTKPKTHDTLRADKSSNQQTNIAQTTDIDSTIQQDDEEKEGTIQFEVPREPIAISVANHVLRPSDELPSVPVPESTNHAAQPIIPSPSHARPPAPAIHVFQPTVPVIPNLIPQYHPSNASLFPNMNNGNFSGNILAGTFVSPHNNQYNAVYNPQANIYNNTSPPLYNPMQMQNNTSMQYVHSHFTNDNTKIRTPPPSNPTDYYWLCYHFQNGDVLCKYGINCQWRHYSFEEQMDYPTTWNFEFAQNNPPTLSGPQLDKVMKLKARMEVQYPWLCEDMNNHGSNMCNDNNDQYQRIISLMAPFDAQRNDNFDYYALGKLILQQLRSMGSKSNAENCVCGNCGYQNYQNVSFCQMCQFGL